MSTAPLEPQAAKLAGFAPLALKLDKEWRHSATPSPRATPSATWEEFLGKRRNATGERPLAVGRVENAIGRCHTTGGRSLTPGEPPAKVGPLVLRRKSARLRP